MQLNPTGYHQFSVLPHFQSFNIIFFEPFIVNATLQIGCCALDCESVKLGPMIKAIIVKIVSRESNWRVLFKGQSYTNYVKVMNPLWHQTKPVQYLQKPLFGHSTCSPVKVQSD